MTRHWRVYWHEQVKITIISVSSCRIVKEVQPGPETESRNREQVAMAGLTGDGVKPKKICSLLVNTTLDYKSNSLLKTFCHLATHHSGYDPTLPEPVHAWLHTHHSGYDPTLPQCRYYSQESDNDDAKPCGH